MPSSPDTEVTRRRALAGAGALAISMASGPARAAPALPQLRRGIGIHHLLNWPDVTGEGAAFRYTWPPFATAGYQISTGELAALRHAGFDFIRLTVDPSIFIATAEDRRPELEHHALEVVQRVLGAGFTVIVDLHPVRVNPAYRPEVLVDPDAADVFSAYVDMVGRVATLLRGQPADRVLLEVFNEPWIDAVSEAPRWQAMMERLHARARQADPARPIVLNGLQWDSVQGLLALDPRPFRDSPVLYTFHYYDPHAFTHQGVQGDTKWLSGLRWPEDDGNAQAVLARALAAIEADTTLGAELKEQARRDTRGYIQPLLRDHPGAARIDADFKKIARWAGDHAIPRTRILLGEFGCAAQPQSTAADRLAWLRAVRVASEAAGFAWSYWSYKGTGGMQLVTPGGGLDPDTLTALGLTLRG